MSSIKSIFGHRRRNAEEGAPSCQTSQLCPQKQKNPGLGPYGASYGALLLTTEKVFCVSILFIVCSLCFFYLVYGAPYGASYVISGQSACVSEKGKGDIEREIS